MRNAVKIGFVALTVAAIMVSGPTAYACSQEYDENYYNSSGCWQGERYLGCMRPCEVIETGTLDGAHWKHKETWLCDGTQHTNNWYVWDGSAWVSTSDPGLPGC